MSEAEAGGGRRYVVLAVVIMLLAALPFSPLVSFRSSQHIDTESASLDSNLPTKDSDNDGLPDWWEIEFDLNPLSVEEINNLIKNHQAIYDLKVDKRVQKIGYGNKLEKCDLKKLPSYINDNLDKFKDWID